MNNVVFFNKLAALRAHPTIKNLFELAKVDPIQADLEINDFAHVCMDMITDRENVFWLIGYIQGLCANKTLGSHENSLKEFEERLNKYCLGGEFRYRLPYRPKP